MLSLFDDLNEKSDGESYGRVDGVMIATVTNNKDPEKLGRVKLKFPLREITQESDWVRIVTFMGGKDRGSLFVPEVGDEVLVAFHLGDFSQPFVIGTLWSTEQPAPLGDDNNNIRKIKTKSGHEIIFDDTDSSEKITIKTKKGHNLVLDDKQDQIVLKDSGGKNTLEIAAGSTNTVTLKSSSTKLVLDAKGDITLSGDKSVTVKAPQIKLEAAGSLSLKSGGMMDLKSDGIINIKGSLVKLN